MVYELELNYDNIHITLPAAIVDTIIRRVYPSNVPQGIYLLRVACQMVGYLLVLTDPIVTLRDRDMQESVSSMKW